MAETLVRIPSAQSQAHGNEKNLIALALVCLLLSGIIRPITGVDQEATNYRARDTSKIVGGDWLAGMLLGFREMVADLMWIQVDSYFHEGRYDKILPVCYVITAMDPSWIEVYTTGAWHLGYNFGDRRLVPAAIDFDRRGVINNPKNADMRYELGWMEWTRGYRYKEAAADFKAANDMHLTPAGRRHAWPHALEESGDRQGALAAWQQLLKEDPKDVVASKQIFLLEMREEARKNLGKNPVEVHMEVKLTRKGPRVLHLEGVTNLPLYSKIFYDLRDSNWKEMEKQSLAYQMRNYTLYSQTDTTLQPAIGIFQGQAYDFYKGDLHVHQGNTNFDQFPSEPVLPVVGGHMIIRNGYFKGDIDMAKQPEQYPLKSDTYILRLFVNPRMEPITTQDIIGWDGQGMSGPLVHANPATDPRDRYNIMEWTQTLKRSDIDPTAK